MLSRKVVKSFETNLKNSMELMSGVVVEEKGQAWSDLPHGIAVSGRQAFKKIQAII